MTDRPMPPQEWADAQDRGAMTDEPDVIAQDGNYRVLADGTAQMQHGGPFGALWGDPVRLSQEDQDVLALLADAVKRVREELTHDEQGYMGTVRSARSAATERSDRLERRIEAVENDLALESTRIANEGSRRAELSDRLAAVEKRQETQRLILDSARIAMDMGNKEFRSLADRVSALEQEPFVEHGRWLALGDRVADLEKSLGGAQSVRERSRFLDEFRDALEARQQDEAGAEPSDDPDYVFDLEQPSGQPLRCLTDHQYNLLRDTASEATRNYIRGELAREIALSIRVIAEIGGAPGKHGDRWAEWIEREFGGEMAKRAGTETVIPFTTLEHLSNEVTERVRRETAQKIADWLRKRYSYDDAYGSSDKAKHASDIVMGAAAQIERDYCK